MSVVPDTFWQIIGQKCFQLIIQDDPTWWVVNWKDELILAVRFIAASIYGAASVAGVEEEEAVIWLGIAQQPLNS